MKDLDGLRSELRYLADEVRPVDLHGRALATSRRIGRQRFAAVAGGLATIAVAATVLVSLTGNKVQPPPPLPVAPSPTVLPTPAPQPPTTPSMEPFANAYVTVPSWGAADNRCVTGRVLMGEGGQYVPADDTKTVVNVGTLVASDVDGDGDQDYFVDLSCGEGPESPARQVVAFRRSGSELTPIGVVVRRNTGDIEMISEIEDRGGGRIGILVSNAYSDGGYRFVPFQWRVYAWQSGRFQQVDGPTSFPADPLAINVTIDNPVRMEFEPTADGQLAGVLSFTLRNVGQLDAAKLELRLALPPEVRPAGDSWTGCVQTSTPKVSYINCELPGLAAGGALPLRFTVVAPNSGIDTKGEGYPPFPFLEFEQLPPYQYEKAMPRGVPIEIVWPSASPRATPTA